MGLFNKQGQTNIWDFLTVGMVVTVTNGQFPLFCFFALTGIWGTIFFFKTSPDQLADGAVKIIHSLRSLCNVIFAVGFIMVIGWIVYVRRLNRKLSFFISEWEREQAHEQEARKAPNAESATN